MLWYKSLKGNFDISKKNPLSYDLAITIIDISSMRDENNLCAHIYNQKVRSISPAH